MSPANAGMSEEERRELIARQHRALYGADSTLYSAENPSSRGPTSQDARVTAGAPGFRGGSPYETFGAGNDSSVTMPARDRQRQSRSRANSNASPSSNNANNSSLNAYDSNQQQATRTSNSSPRGSPPRDSEQAGAAAASNVAPIGTRPTPTQQQQQGAVKRSTPPITSPLGYGFAGEQGQGEKPAAGQEDKSNIRGAWGNSGPWGGKGGIGVQAKVWG